MAEIVPVPAGGARLNLVSGRRLPRAVQAAVDDELAQGLVSAARVEAAAWVAHEGMTRLSLLTALEQHHAAGDPTRAAYYAALVDDFVVVARQSVRRLGGRP